MKRKFIGLLVVQMLAVMANAARIDSLFILGGELSNSAVTCIADIDEVMPRMKKLGLNTVLTPVYWDLTEPREGHFDFTLVDRTIMRARENDLKVVFLWFGAWKNSMSCYAPLWFKKDIRRFPRARTRIGKPLEIASTFSENVLKADNRAFGELMRHIKEVDTGRTVIMVQIENEIGMLEEARDCSPEAQKAYAQGVPDELMKGLKHTRLHPWLKERFTGKGKAWTDVFGDDIHTDEIFMAWYYARYVEQLALTARKVCDMPLYVNAAMNSRGRKPGDYPSAGPLAHLIDIWHIGAPSIDMLCPDIYDTGFKGWAGQYALWNNPLFIPETRCTANAAARAFYAFGEHEALGFSPFAIDKASARDVQAVARSYRLLDELRPLLRDKKMKRYGLLFDSDDKERIIGDDGVILTCRHYFTLPWDARATDGSTWPEGGAVVIRLGHNDYLIAGTGVVVSFATAYEQLFVQSGRLGEDGFALDGGENDAGDMQNADSSKTAWKGKRIGIGSVDEVHVNADGSLVRLRSHNGDESHQGRHARIAVDDFKILHVRLYEYW